MKYLAENSHIYLAYLEEGMAKDIHQNSLDEDNKRFVPDEVFETEEIAKEVINDLILSYQNKEGPFVYAIIRKEDMKNIGYVQLVNISEGWEIGYHIAKQYTGKGFATEAVNLYLDHLKNNTDIKEVYGVALLENKASLKVLNKCGFIKYFEGIDLYQGNKREIVKTIRKL